MQRFFSIVVILMSYSLWGYGQDCSYTVGGTIYDASTKAPLPFATVLIKGTDKGTAADSLGRFELTRICNTEFDLVISYIGYKTIVHHHDAHHKLPRIYLAPDDITLESVVIEGEKDEGQLKTTTLEEVSGVKLEENNSGTLTGALRNVTGVSALTTGQNVSKPIIHGLHSNRVLVINNGIRHEFQNWGADHGPEIDPSLAESVQVVKGAATVRYGPDALGGVILIDGPKMLLDEKLHGDAGIIANSNGRSAETDITLHKGFKKLAFMAQGSYVIQGDLRAPDYLLTNTGKRENSVTVGARYHRPKYDLNLYYSHFGQQLGVLRGSVNGNLEDLEHAIESPQPVVIDPFSYDLNNPKQQVNHDLIKLEGVLHAEDQSLSFKYAFQDNHRQEFDVRRGVLNEKPSIDLNLISHSFDMDWKHPAIAGWNGQAGVQWTYQDNNNNPGTNTIPFMPNYNINRVGVYVIESKKIGQTIWEGGIRYDYQYFSVRGREQDNSIYRNELTYSNFSGTLGINRVLTEHLSFKSNIGSAWRAPNIYELYVFGKHESSLEYGMWRYTVNEDGSVDSNVLLDENDRKVYSEIGVKWINTLQWHTDKWNAEVTVYANFIKHFIYSTPAGTTVTTRGALPYFLYNQTDALLTGVDATAIYTHNEKLTSTARVSYLYSRDLENKTYFVEMPPLRLDYEVRYSPKISFLPNAHLYLNTSYQFRQWDAPMTISVGDILKSQENDENLFVPGETFDFIDPPKGFFNADFGISTEKRRFQYRLQIDNLLNQSYRLYTDRFRYFADETGINFRLSVKYKIP